MTSKLTIYNGALTVLGERKLANLTENREPRHKLDDIWENEMIRRVLQHGQWKFALRAVELQASPSITPSFGYQYAFDIPTDHVRTLGIASDEYFSNPLTAYSVEAAWWFSDAETIYVQYVSSDSQFGEDYSLWPENFTEYVEHYMAMKVAPRLIGLVFDSNKLKTLVKKTLLEAKSTDAMESPARFAPKGGWAQSRQGFRSGSTERGNRSQLIG